MNETKHTPGPWRVRANDLLLTVETIKGEAVALPCSGTTVSAPYNARLIAAAPELAKVLRSFLSRWEYDHEAEEETEGEPEEVYRARAVLTKVGI